MIEGNSVLIVGRNEILREGLRRILVETGFDARAISPDGLMAAMEDGVAFAPQLIILDSGLEAADLEACRALRDHLPSARLVLLGEECDLESAASAFAVGADGYLGKAISCEPLIGALKLILMGEKVLPSQAVEALMRLRTHSLCGDVDSWRTSVNLSDREVQILSCLIEGEANKIISRRLDITEATVKVHVKAILRKLRVQNRTQAAVWAVNRGLVQSATKAAVTPLPHRADGQRPSAVPMH